LCEYAKQQLSAQVAIMCPFLLSFSSFVFFFVCFSFCVWMNRRQQAIHLGREREKNPCALGVASGFYCRIHLSFSLAVLEELAYTTVSKKGEGDRMTVLWQWALHSLSILLLGCASSSIRMFPRCVCFFSPYFSSSSSIGISYFYSLSRLGISFLHPLAFYFSRSPISS
jgi:hypothetical protein